MWKNVFIESCILSALIFGGFYFNAAHLKNEISGNQDALSNGSKDKLLWAHISGFDIPVTDSKGKKKLQAHFSGNTTTINPVAPISGADQPPLPVTE